MQFAKSLLLHCTVILLACAAMNAQQTATSTTAVVPRLVNFSGRAMDDGKVITGATGATFAIYSEESGGSPLWLETQNIQADAKGNYMVQLGATKPEGLPLDLFTSGEARWLGVTINGGQEQPRLLLLSVPYALKAADAETVGGLPASAFLLAGAANGGATQNNIAITQQSSTSPKTSSDVTTNGGTVNTFPLFTTATNVQSSILTQTGSGTAGKIGINTATPASTLDVNGAGTIRGNLSLPATGTATTTVGKNSQPLTFITSSYNSGTGSPVNQNFRWQAEPSGNNTAGASGTLNLLYSAGANTPAETGLKIGKNGEITFASGQTYPGAGTITDIIAGTDLTGGGTGGKVTLNVNTSALNSTYAQLAASNKFTGNQGVEGNLGVAGTLSAETATANYVSIYSSSTNGEAVEAVDSAGGYGVYGQSDTGYGIYGVSSTSLGVSGSSNTGIGVSGYSFNAQGIQGISTNSIGVEGDAFSSSTYGVFGNNNASTGGYGVYGNGYDGVVGQGISIGVSGSSGYVGGIGVAAYSDTTGGDGLFAENQTEGGYAAFFLGNVDVDGTLSKAGGSFKIDDPLDPANKYLYHSFVESPDMMNIYNGNVTTDAEGNATVQMPDWFEALNRDFRYQLTVIGQFAQAYISRELENRQFSIKTDKPNVKISWQVTGIRQDAWANAHRIPVEIGKPANERGYYMHPELFGAPADRSIAAHRHPGMIKPPAQLSPAKQSHAEAQMILELQKAADKRKASTR